jgi:hypothetical protein
MFQLASYRCPSGAPAPDLAHAWIRGLDFRKIPRRRPALSGRSAGSRRAPAPPEAIPVLSETGSSESRIRPGYFTRRIGHWQASATL